MTTISKQTQEAKSDVADVIHDAGERLVDFKDDSLRTLGKRIDQLGEAMKEHPLLAIGIGIGVGYLLARIIHRS